MAVRIAFAVCEHYLREAQQALAAEKLDDAVIIAFPCRCGRPPLSWEELSVLTASSGGVEHVEIFGGCCLNSLANLIPNRRDLHIHKLEQCFHLVADPVLINRCLEKGAYLTTPGWLTEWPNQMERLGLNQETAREMFSETTTGIVLFDTGVDEDSYSNLQTFASYVNRPLEIIYTGLSTLCLLLARTYLKRQMEIKQRKAAAEIQHIQRQSAQYAMAIDLLSSLARIVNESEAVEAMLDVYRFLFAPKRLCYLRIQDGKPDQLWVRPDILVDDSERETIKNRLNDFHDDSGYRQSSAGFVMSIVQSSETKALISIEDVAFPEYLEQYLNLALSIAGICELPIENARRYEIIVATEEKLRKANEKLYQLSTMDALTGIANRRAYDAYIDIEWKKMLRNHTPLSLILCDIDYFKKYNDHYGHGGGDTCLHTVAQIIHEMALRPGDFVARYGGEEFVVILPDTPTEGAFHIAERIRTAVAQRGISHECSDVAPHVTISLGVAQFNPPLPAQLSPGALFHVADAALYEAKRQGRNRTVIKTIDDYEA
jgi:diguanylate cyclase (GGDEF)-like protein